jgi:cysteinyl-tRNA synthetase
MMNTLVLTNTATGVKESFVVQNNKPITLYVCGITPYDAAHLGHGRSAVVFDSLVRVLQLLGGQIIYCRNITDIDDKLLNRAQQELHDVTRYHEIATTYTQAYQHELEQLGCLRPTYEPKVTDHIPLIIDFIRGLIERGNAYVVEGNVYFSIDSFPSYGMLSRRTHESLQVGARVALCEHKRNPLDFALWKVDHTGVAWESPWGAGRPGWHIECSVLASHYLGATIDIHGGGMDLIFPHHENERAQSEALFQVPFVKIWMHNAFVRIDHEKMSKSLNNFKTLQSVLADYDPMVVRLYFLEHHYRNPLDWQDDVLKATARTYERITQVLGDAEFKVYVYDELISCPLVMEMVAMLKDDLNIAGFLGLFFEHIQTIRENQQIKKYIKYLMVQVLGLTCVSITKNTEITPVIEKLLVERQKARSARDWAHADILRDELKKLGYQVQDEKLKK